MNSSMLGGGAMKNVFTGAETDLAAPIYQEGTQVFNPPSFWIVSNASGAPAV